MGSTETERKHKLIPTGDATAILPASDNVPPINVIGNAAIGETFDDNCLQQAINSRMTLGVSLLVLNPDAGSSDCGSGFGSG